MLQFFYDFSCIRGFWPFSFMNCINNFSICVKIYCQIPILFLFCLDNELRQSWDGIPPTTHHPGPNYKYIFTCSKYRALVHRYTTVLHQDNNQRVNNSNSTTDLQTS